MVKLFESFGVLRALFSFKNKTPCSTQASRTPSQPGWDRELVYYSCPIPSPALLSERWAAQNPTMALCNNILCIWSRYLRKEVSVLPNCLHSSLIEKGDTFKKSWFLFLIMNLRSNRDQNPICSSPLLLSGSSAGAEVWSVLLRLLHTFSGRTAGLQLQWTYVDDVKFLNWFFTDFTYTFEVWGIKKAWRFRSCAKITMKLDLFTSYLLKEKLMRFGKSAGPWPLHRILGCPSARTQPFTWVRSAPAPSPRRRRPLRCR